MKQIFLLFCLSFILYYSAAAQNFNMTFRSEVTYPYSCASVWAYVDDDKEYALLGTYEGVAIIDVTNPDVPVVLFDVEHTPSQWREIKTYGHYAYATNESGGGLLIIDLSDLPNSYQQYSFTYEDGDGHLQENGHTLWIDENGRLYIFGGSYGIGGATMFDLTVDPLNPPFVGKYEEQYIHDGYARGDTLWASEIWAGQLELVDVSNPANPDPMASQGTPSHFTHNAWPTNNNHYVFTTDEVDDSYLTSYDVSNLFDITELDRVQSNPGSNVIIHNVHLYNDSFAAVAYYKDGVVIFDVSHPDNMIEVASYDTDPGEAGGGYGGTWGVYPYLPSGNWLASDLYDAGAPGGKLTVLTPTLVSASWLEGNITDSTTGAPINNAFIEILSTQENDYSSLGGDYKTGTGMAGTYTIRVSKAPDYKTKEIPNVVLTSGVVTNLDVQLALLPTSTIKGIVLDSVTNQPIENASVYVRSVPASIDYNTTTDAAGNFSIPSVFYGSYDIFVGKWGHHEKGVYNTYIDASASAFEFKLSEGYYDDFILDFDWGISSTAATGEWERGEPIGTFDSNIEYNPDDDLAGDWGDYCYVTGNGGGSAFDDDVDNGKTWLESPSIDATGYNNPMISYYAWFANAEVNGDPPNDTLYVSITDQVTTVTVHKIHIDNFPTSQWNYHFFNISDYLTPTSNMQVTFQASDLNNSGNWVEAAIDVFRVDESISTGINQEISAYHNSKAYPNPFSSQTTIEYNLQGDSFVSARVDIYDIMGRLVESLPVKNISGTVECGTSWEDGMYVAKLIVDDKAIQVIPLIKIQQ